MAADPNDFVDWDSLQRDLTEAVTPILYELIEEGAEDVQKFGAQIAAQMIAAALEGNQDWTEELEAQVRVLAEIQRLRLSQLRWRLLTTILKSLFRAAVKALASVAVSTLLAHDPNETPHSPFRVPPGEAT